MIVHYSNSAVAYYDGKTVTANSAGTCTVGIETEDGHIRKDITVTVLANEQQQQSQSQSSNNGSNGGQQQSQQQSQPQQQQSQPQQQQSSQQSSSGNNNGGNSNSNNGGNNQSSQSAQSSQTNDGSPQLTEDWLRANCKAITAEDGTVVYELPQLMTYINEYRRNMGLHELTWNGTTSSYEDYMKMLQSVKDETDPVFYMYLPNDYPGCFDENVNIILTRDYYNAHYANQSNPIANETAYLRRGGSPHTYAGGGGSINASGPLTTVKCLVEQIHSSDPHWAILMMRNKDGFYACIAVDSNGNFWLSII
ncbi:hypothetical protein IJ707_03785 [bacterium]|nr:hypothetical protein [bacterium]